MTEVIVKSSPLALEIQGGSVFYSIFLLPANYLQIVATSIVTRSCYFGIFDFELLNKTNQTMFKDSQEFFEAIRNASSKSVVFYKSGNKILTLTFSFRNQMNSIDFQLQQRGVSTKIDEIGDYKQRLQKVCTQNKKLLVENKQKDEKIQQLSIKLQLARSNLDINSERLKDVEEQRKKQYHCRYKSESLETFPFKTTFKIPLQSSDYSCKIEEKKKLSSFNFVAVQTQFLNNFTIEGQKIRIEKQFKDFYQVTSQSSVPLVGKTSISIKILHTNSSNIYFGLLKESRKKQKFTCQHRECISYKLRGGKFLFEDGFQTGEEVPWLKEGQILSLSIDREKMEVTWFVEGKYMIKRRLPESMQKSQLYAFVSLHDQGDEVEII